MSSRCRLPKVVGSESCGVKGERGQSTGVEKQEGWAVSERQVEERELQDFAEKVGVRGLVLSAIVLLPPSIFGLQIFADIDESWGTIMEQLKGGMKQWSLASLRVCRILYSCHKYN